MTRLGLCQDAVEDPVEAHGLAAPRGAPAEQAREQDGLDRIQAEEKYHEAQSERPGRKFRQLDHHHYVDPKEQQLDEKRAASTPVNAAGLP